MAISLYFDHHVPRAIALGLRLRGMDILTAYEKGAGEMAAPELLDRAGALGGALFTRV